MNKDILETYKGFEILEWSNGFEHYFSEKSGSIGKFDIAIIAKFVVRTKDQAAGFAFAVSGLDMFAEPESLKFTQESLTHEALKTIKEYLDSQEILHLQQLKYEFLNNSFIEVKNPEWWKP
jgi:hypothetical protein